MELPFLVAFINLPFELSFVNYDGSLCSFYVYANPSCGSLLMMILYVAFAVHSLQSLVVGVPRSWKELRTRTVVLRECSLSFHITLVLMVLF